MVEQATAAKRLFILGATGGIGRAIVDQAIERGHKVTAFVRSPEKLGAPRAGLTVLKGDPRNVDELRAALPGHDAVLSALGPRGSGTNNDQQRLRAEHDGGHGGRRCPSAADRFGRRALRQPRVRVLAVPEDAVTDITQDSAEMERLVVASGLDWTIVRPPSLTNGRLTGHYAIEDDRMPSGGHSVSRADVAQFLLNELDCGAHVRRMVGMASAKSAAAQRSSGHVAGSETHA